MTTIPSDCPTEGFCQLFPTMSTVHIAPRVRSLYRRLLRELPTRSPAALLAPSPLQRQIRQHLDTPPATASSNTSVPSDTAPPSTSAIASALGPNLEKLERELASVDQYIQYLRAQRVHTTLLERYNPGMNMSEEDRLRLTARRVGMDLPEALKARLEGKGDKE